LFDIVSSFPPRDALRAAARRLWAARRREQPLRAARTPRYAGSVSDPADPPHVVIDADGAELRLVLRRHPRARRVSLRADARSGDIVLVLPRRAALQTALGFARSQAHWIRARLAQVPPAMPFADGAVVEILGVPLTIRHDPALRGPATRDGDFLRVGGAPEFVARRVRDFLRAEALRLFAPLAEAKASTIGRRVVALRVADTRSRWGSCARGGKLSFSWRLVLAPATVVDYVVAHEVAHLAHHDHGPAFWLLVDRLTPHRVSAQPWLRGNGIRLLRAGLVC
jgi:predicted metal-dependent hydrolase